MTPAPLRSPAFRSVWLAGVVSEAGDWLLLIALPLVVYTLTGSALGTSLAFLVGLAPGILLAPVAGWCADRFDRRRLLIGLTAAQAVTLVPLLLVHGRAELGVVYAVILVEAALLALFDPVKNALLPDLVEGADLVSANSLIGLGQNTARLVGGPLGGVFLAAGGLRLVVAVDLVTCLVAGLLLATVRTAPEPGPAAGSAAPPTGSLAFARDPNLRLPVVITFLGQVAQGIFVVLFILFVAEQLHGGSAEVGLLRGVQAVGAIVGGLVLAALARRWSPATLTAAGALAFAGIDLVLWNGPLVTTATAVYVALFILIGAPGIVMTTGLITEVQQASAPRDRGRAFAVMGVAQNAGQAVGMVAAGGLTTRVGLLPMLNGQALLYLATGLLAARAAANRRLRSAG